MSKGFSSPSTGRRKLLTTSSKVTVNLPKEKRKVCKVGHQQHTRCLRPLASLKTSRFLEIATTFRIWRAPDDPRTPRQNLLIHPNGPTLDLPSNKIKKDGNRLLKSPPNLEIKNLSRVWDLSGTNETCLPREYPSVSG